MPLKIQKSSSKIYNVISQKLSITSFRSAILRKNSHKKSSYQAHKTRWGRYTKSRSKTAALNHPLLFFPLSFLLSSCSFSRYHFFGIEVHCSRTEISIFSHFFVLMYFHLQQESNRLRVPIWYGLSHEFMVSRMKTPQLQRHFESRKAVEVKWRSWR